jgi:hypothetical protein
MAASCKALNWLLGKPAHLPMGMGQITYLTGYLTAGAKQWMYAHKYFASN